MCPSRMSLSKAVAGAALLFAVLYSTIAMPEPGVIRERHIIRTPINYKIIHHHKIKKIPLIIKKHVHYYKPTEEVHHHETDEHHPPVFLHSNQIHHEDNNGHGQFYPGKYEIPEILHEGSHHGTQEDYEEQSQEVEEDEGEEEEEEDYDYE